MLLCLSYSLLPNFHHQDPEIGAYMPLNHPFHQADRMLHELFVGSSTE